METCRPMVPLLEDHEFLSCRMLPGGRCPCYAGRFRARCCTTGEHGPDTPISVEVLQL